jgi:vesicle-associated membrane protein 7
MPILYAAVAEDGHLTTEATTEGTRKDFSKVISVLLDRLEHRNYKKSYSHDGYSYNYIVEDDVAYLCVATMDIPTRMCFGFLSKIKNLYDGGEEFDAVLEEQMVYFNTDPKVDKIRGIQSDVKAVQDIMMENIENVLQRGERLEDVLQKTEKMDENASVFRKSSRKLSRVMWWRNVKLNICLCFICLILIVVIFFVVVWACGGFSFPKCGAP